MTDGAELPDNYGENIDWSVLEHIANNDGSTEGAPKESGPGVTILSQAMLTRRLLWDTVPCDIAAATVDYLGLPKVSEDVEATEHKAAHQRLTDVRVLSPIIQAISMSATQAIVGSMFAEEEPEHGPESEEYRDAVEKMFPPIYAATLGGIAELVDIGLLHTPHLVEFDPDDPDGPSFTMRDSNDSE